MSAATAEPASLPEIETNLAWEAKNRTWAGVVAVLAGLLLIAGAAVTAIALKDKPAVTTFDALRDATGARAEQDGLKASTVLFLHDKAGTLTLGSVLTALASLLAALALVYLYRAVRARHARLGQFGLIALAVGGVLGFVGPIIAQVALSMSASDFASATDHSTIAAHDAMQPNGALVGTLVGYIGTLALALGWLVCAINGMRVGLLTRFLGVLGIIGGVLFIVPLVSLPIIQAFFLVALGALILRLQPRLVPPAWTSGKAEPWPTRQEQVAARQEALEAKRAAYQASKGSENGVVEGEAQHLVREGAPERVKKKRRRG